MIPLLHSRTANSDGKLAVVLAAAARFFVHCAGVPSAAGLLAKEWGCDGS